LGNYKYPLNNYLAGTRFCKYVMFPFPTSMSTMYDFVANISLCNIFTQDADGSGNKKSNFCKYVCTVHYGIKYSIL